MLYMQIGYLIYSDCLGSNLTWPVKWILSERSAGRNEIVHIRVPGRYFRKSTVQSMSNWLKDRLGLYLTI